jgi:hypothetical protein
MALNAILLPFITVSSVHGMADAALKAAGRNL